MIESLEHWHLPFHVIHSFIKHLFPTLYVIGPFQRHSWYCTSHADSTSSPIPLSFWKKKKYVFQLWCHHVFSISCEVSVTRTVTDSGDICFTSSLPPCATHPLIKCAHIGLSSRWDWRYSTAGPLAYGFWTFGVIPCWFGSFRVKEEVLLYEDFEAGIEFFF